MPYPDLSTMFQNGMGSFAAIQAGRMQQSQQEQDAANLQSTQLQNQQTQVMNPLNAQFRQGQINEQQAQLPGQVGLSQQQAVAGNVAQATQADQIAEKLYGLKNQIGAHGFTEMAQNAQIASYAASMLESVPAMNRPAALSQILSKYGVDSNNPMVKPIIEGDPNNIVPALNNLGKGMALASAKYQQEAAIEDKKTASARELGLLHANTQVTVEDRKAASNERIASGHDASRVSAAEARTKALMNRMSTDDKIAFLQTIPESQKTDEDRNNLIELKTLKLQENAARTPAVAPTVLNQPTPLEAAATAARGGAPAITAPTQLTPDTVAKAFGKYEPEKYQYRINNGVVQRAPK